MDYKLIRKPGLKHMYLRVDKDLGVVVKANEYVSIKEINQFVAQKELWIHDRLLQAKNRLQKKSFASGCMAYYLGKEYELSVSRELNSGSMVFVKDGRIFIKAPDLIDADEVEELLDHFYKQKAIHLVSGISDYWSKVMGLYPNKISFRKARTRWGSCSAKNNISYNIELIKLPENLISYVVVHELAHIVHKNHSQSFWSLVKLYMPDYLLRRKRIRVLEKKIFF